MEIKKVVKLRKHVSQILSTDLMVQL
jgi:hypothetical protein